MTVSRWIVSTTRAGASGRPPPARRIPVPAIRVGGSVTGDEAGQVKASILVMA